MNRASRWTGVVLAAALAGSVARGQTTQMVSVATSGVQGNSHSNRPTISPDGRYVAFLSYATNLVPGDTNNVADVFLRDLQSGNTERVSVTSGGAEANGLSGVDSISTNGRFVAFATWASNLVAGDINGWVDVFVHDRLTATTELVSLATSGTHGDHVSSQPSISADGRFVAFYSRASTLVSGDTNRAPDVFVRDRLSGTTERVSVDSAGTQTHTNSQSIEASISADGRYVAFRSNASNLVSGDTNGTYDAFVRDRQNGTTERVSVATGGAQSGGGGSYPSISADGRFVAFESGASNLVAVDTNGFPDIFVHDRQSGTTERVSVATDRAQGNEWCSKPSISADGRFVAFQGLASNLIADDTNAAWDTFVHDRQIGTTERVSVATSGEQGASGSSAPSISADGWFVTFWSHAPNLVAGDTNAAEDAFVRDRGEPPIVASCFGDGTGASCPCGNNGLAGHGCENSSISGGALLSVAGSSSLSSDTLVLTSSGETPMVLSIFLQGSDLIAPAIFGDGLRCAGGTLRRLFYVVISSGGVATAPQGSDPSVSTRSAALGDPIPIGATRHYQTYYRDPDLGFCPAPPGNSWNVSNALSAVWSP